MGVVKDIERLVFIQDFAIKQISEQHDISRQYLKMLILAKSLGKFSARDLLSALRANRRKEVYDAINFLYGKEYIEMVKHYHRFNNGQFGTDPSLYVLAWKGLYLIRCYTDLVRKMLDEK